MSFENRNLIVGVGSALIDVLIHEDDAFIERNQAQKGGMNLVGDDYLNKVLQQSPVKPQIVPGGSACNTIIGVANLGGNARFVGKRGSDEYGELFERDLAANSVSPKLLVSTIPTGRVLTIITSDAQRTFLTHLGAAETMTPSEIDAGCFENAAIVHLEGYLLFNPDLIKAIIKTVKEAGAYVSLDLASYTVVEANREMIQQIVVDDVDILLANEDEAFAFTGYQDEAQAIDILSRNVELAALKMGGRGSYIAFGGEVTKIDPFSNGTIVDTTGAGDFWAAGLLFGLVNRFPIEQCGQLASRCGFEVCKGVGATIAREDWGNIKKLYIGGV